MGDSRSFGCPPYWSQWGAERGTPERKDHPVKYRFDLDVDAEDAADAVAQLIKVLTDVPPQILMDSGFLVSIEDNEAQN